jgi:DNA-binding CsgD family transcriptional regulator
VQGAGLAEPGFVGRQEELAAIATAAAAAVESRPSVVWISGEAGSGKTHLLRKALRDLPPGFRVLRAEADELAHDVAFDIVGQLGVRQVAAAFPAGLALLEQWGRLQTDGPVAVAVEDLHWADPESRAALLVAARRLGQDRLLMLVTSRLGSDRADGWARLRRDQERCVELPLAPLSVTEVSEMARQGGRSLSTEAAERLFRHTTGHPLYVKTLLMELSPEQLARPDRPLPAPRSLASATVARLLELPDNARDLAATLAVINQRTSLLVAARVGSISDPWPALDSLLLTEFVDSEETDRQRGLALAHPLYRAAIYTDLAPSRRQQLHRAAAEVLGGRVALAHRVAAADAVDDALAAELEAAALEELFGGRFNAAGGYLLSAAQMTSPSLQAHGRLLMGARFLLAGGQTAQVETLRASLEACPASPARSLVLGVLACDQGDSVTAERRLREAAGLAGPQATSGGYRATSDTAADALAQLALVYITQARPREAIAAAAAALAYKPLAYKPLAAGAERAASTVEALGQAMLGGPDAGLARFASRLPAHAGEVGAADVDLLIVRGALHYFAGHLTQGIADLRAATGLARRQAALQLPSAHLHLAQMLFDTGEWDESLVQGRVALSLLSDERRTWVEAQAHAILSSVLAGRGQWEQAEEQLSQAEGAAAALDNSEARSAIVMGRAALARARDEPGKVVEVLTWLVDDLAQHRQQTKIGTIDWYPWLIGALIDTGDLRTAGGHLAQLRLYAADRGLDFTCRIVGLEARLHVAEGRLERAEAAFRHAVELLRPDDPMLDRALLHHAFGRFLHSRRDRRQAMDELRRAHDLLTFAAATPFALRVEHDLDLRGHAGVATSESSPFDLTDREADVAALVAKGLTNRESAAQLYVSIKTVEYHLGNVFTKLGISSRRELRHAFVRS